MGDIYNELLRQVAQANNHAIPPISEIKKAEDVRRRKKDPKGKGKNEKEVFADKLKEVAPKEIEENRPTSTIYELWEMATASKRTGEKYTPNEEKIKKIAKQAYEKGLKDTEEER